MSYQVLARKWRPHTFKDMVGQEPILRMLSNAIDQKRLHHAYLFTGTRGVGKTTLGRILAKCLNCETSITSNPCGTCYICQAIDHGQFLDLYEIDAASRTKVEDTRELLENVLYPPTQGRYKIYLIDEVHMLSNHSFNALLKTLEEPPEHVKFILATTDPKRLPVTILSRCLQFHLKRINTDQIAKHLQFICESEAIKYDVFSLEKLAQAADGSLRDALSLLDQAIAYGHGEIQQNDVVSMLGSMSTNDIIPLLEALTTKDSKTLFDTITQLTDRAPDFDQILTELISLLHHIAIAQIVPQTKVEENIATLAKKFSPEDIQIYYQIALLGRRDLAYAPIPQQGFEMTMIRMMAFKATVIPEKSTIVDEPTEIKPIKKVVTNVKNESKENLDWREMLPHLGLSGMSYALASNCILVNKSGNKIELALSENHKPMFNQKLQDRIAEALSGYFKETIDLKINITTSELFTPVKQMQDEKQQHLANATHTIMQDPKVKQLVEMYDATVEISLIS